LPADLGGDLDLRSGGTPPLNAFVALDELSARAGLDGGVNLCVSGPIEKVNLELPGGPKGGGGAFSYVRRLWYWYILHRPYRPPHPPASTEESLNFLAAGLQKTWSLKDAGLDLGYATGSLGLDMRSPRVVLERPVVTAAAR